MSLELGYKIRFSLILGWKWVTETIVGNGVSRLGSARVCACNFVFNSLRSSFGFNRSLHSSLPPFLIMSFIRRIVTEMYSYYK